MAAELDQNNIYVGDEIDRVSNAIGDVIRSTNLDIHIVDLIIRDIYNQVQIMKINNDVSRAQVSTKVMKKQEVTDGEHSG